MSDPRTFTLHGEQINIEQGWSNIDGLVYHLLLDGRQIAVSSHRGFQVTEGVAFTKAELLSGMRDAMRGRR